MTMYPMSCTSQFCGKINCPDTCKQKPALDEFKAWIKQTNAKKLDPIWSPLFYTST